MRPGHAFALEASSIALGAMLGGCGTARDFAGAPPDAGTADAPRASRDAMTVDSQPWKSGERLRARVMDGGYRAKLFERWLDTSLRIACSFTTAEDGKLRCLPLDEFDSGLARIYSDPGCTNLIAVGPAPENPYVRITDPGCGVSDGDGQRHPVVRWGDLVDVDVPYVKRDGGCSPIVNAPQVTWHTITAIDPLSFVAAIEQIHVSPDGMKMRILAGEDGSSESVQFIDPLTSKPCEVISDHVLGAPSVCVPVPFAVSPVIPYFDGPACERTMAFATPGCNRAEAALVLRNEQCAQTVDIREAGPEIAFDGGTIYRRFAGGACQETTLFYPSAMFSVGAPFAGMAMPLLRDRPMGDDRLQTILHQASDGSTIRNAHLLPIRYQLDPDSTTSIVQPAPYEFYDNVAKTKCFVAEGVDGSLRCVPSNTVPRLGAYFADAACTQPAHLGSNDASCPSTGFVSLPGWLQLGDPLPPVGEIRPIGSVLPEPPYQIARNIGDPNAPPPGTCVREKVVPSRVFYALGDPISASDLPLVVERTE